MQTTLKKIGNSTGVIIPKAILNKLNVEKGDDLYITECEDGIKLSQYDPEFEEQMDAARLIMKKRRNALRELAK